MAVVTIGWFGEDAWDTATDVVDAVADVATSVADRIGDAGKTIGAILNFVAPVFSMFPGIGTAVSVAFSAAAALAAATPIDEAIINAASNAIPGGLPRIGFDTAVNMTKDVAAGRNAFGSAVDGLRGAAQQAGGDRARFAFDTGLGIARGEKVSDQVLRAARDQVAANGTQALAAFDAGVSVAKGEGAKGAALAVARAYIASTGNPLALAAFDSGLALAYGQSLQEAGFAGLQALVHGNDSAERAVRFLQQMEIARAEGRSPWEQLATDLATEAGPFLSQVDAGRALKELQPFLDAIGADPSALSWGSDALAEAWGEAEPLVRAAQAIMRNGQTPDLALRNMVIGGAVVKSIGRVRVSAEVRAREDARWAAILAANPSVSPICLRASDAKARNSPAYADLEAQCKAAGGRPLVRVQASVSASAPSRSILSLLAAAPPPAAYVYPTSVAVPFSPARPVVPFGVAPPGVVRSAKPAAASGELATDLAIGGAVGVAALLGLWFVTR